MVETITIVIVVTIMIIIGIVFWNRVQGSDLQKTAKEAEELSVIEIAKTVADMPELRCYTKEVTTVNCFDLYRLYAFNRTMHDPKTKDAAMSYYSNYFKKSRITFEQTYPFSQTFNITIYDNNISNTTKLQIKIPIIIQDPITQRNGFGNIIVEGYYR